MAQTPQDVPLGDCGYTKSAVGRSAKPRLTVVIRKRDQRPGRNPGARAYMGPKTRAGALSRWTGGIADGRNLMATCTNGGTPTLSWVGRERPTDRGPRRSAPAGLREGP